MPKDFGGCYASKKSLWMSLRYLRGQAFARTGKPVRLIGVDVRFAETTPESAQIDLL